MNSLIFPKSQSEVNVHLRTSYTTHEKCLVQKKFLVPLEVTLKSRVKPDCISDHVDTWIEPVQPSS